MNRKEYRKEWRDKNREKIREYSKKWWKENYSIYNKSNKESFLARIKKNSCRLKTRYAVKTGKIIKIPCEVCHDPIVQAHHIDYSKPMEVMWLCSKHHIEWHHKNDTK